MDRDRRQNMNTKNTKKQQQKKKRVKTERTPEAKS